MSTEITPFSIDILQAATIVHWPEDNPGGHHFAAMEVPDHLTRGMPEFFGKVRLFSRKER